MPELAEVARVVHHLRKNLRNQTIASISFPQEDPNIFQTKNTGLTTQSFADTLKGRKIIDAKQQGKYFWLVMDKPPHPLMHLGMTGWVKFRGKIGAGVDYTRMQDDKQPENAHGSEEWPPRFWKFNIITTSDPPVEASFVDGRRFSRVKLLDCPGNEIRTVSPLKENGPDPVVDADQLTLDFIKDLTSRRKVPIKALLLDQSAVSGIGNWMADEILYQAAIHPAIYANALSEAQTLALHKQILNVCKTAVDLLADSDKFPENWIMKYRWDKGKKDSNILPNGEKIVHVEVGGRTSAIVPSRQKKSAATDKGEQPKAKKVVGKKRGKAIVEAEESDNGAKEEPSAKKGRKSGPSTSDEEVSMSSTNGSRRSSRRISGR